MSTNKSIINLFFFIQIMWFRISPLQSQLTPNVSYLTPASNPELRIKLVDSATPVSLMEKDNQIDCYPYEEFLDPQLHVYLTSQATLYYPVKKDIPLYGLILTLESREYVCDDPWIGVNDIRMLRRALVPMKYADQKFVDRVVSKIILTNWETVNYWPGLTEGEHARSVDCNYASATYKTQLYISVERIKILTSMRWSLLQPVRMDDCIMGTNQSCSISQYSTLYFPSGSLPHGCDLTPLSRIAGVLSMTKKDPSNIHFHSEVHEFDLSLQVSTNSSEFTPECQYHNMNIYSSTEGHLVSFSSRNGSSDIDIILAMLNQRKKRHTFPQNELTNISRAIIRPPPLRLRSIDSTAFSRSKRDNNNNYPEYQRLDYLENKIAWGLSTFEYYVDQLSHVTAQELLRTRYTQCLIKNELVEMALLLHNPTMYAKLKLDDPGFVVLSEHKQHIRLLLGRALSTIRIPNNPYVWCNNSLLIDYKEHGDVWKNGWLQTRTGLIMSSDLHSSSCSIKTAPVKFTIPSYEQGLWDLFTQDFIHLPTNTIRRQELKYSVVNLPIETSELSWKFREHGSEFSADYVTADSWDSVKRLFTSRPPLTDIWLVKILKIVLLGSLILMILRILSCIYYAIPQTPGLPSVRKGTLLQ
nr:putative glycoprotein [Lye Green virus]